MTDWCCQLVEDCHLGLARDTYFEDISLNLNKKEVHWDFEFGPLLQFYSL